MSWRYEVWPKVAGPIATVAAVGVLEALSRFGHTVPNPSAVLLTAVAFSAFEGGLLAGLLATVVGAAYLGHIFAPAGDLVSLATQDLRRYAVFGLAAAAMVGMVGILRRRATEPYIAAAISMQSDLAAAQRAEEASARLAAIVESSDDAIVGQTLAGMITSWNPAAERLYGHPARHAVGKRVHLLSPPGQEGEIDDILRRVRRGERIANMHARRLRADGKVIAVVLTASPIRTRDGRVTGVATIARAAPMERVAP